jgi:hypothetical protein
MGEFQAGLPSRMPRSAQHLGNSGKDMSSSRDLTTWAWIGEKFRRANFRFEEEMFRSAQVRDVRQKQEWQAP